MEKSQEMKRYTKTSLLMSKKYLKYKDLLKVLLDEKIKYTFEEVDKIIDNYLKKEVK